MKLPISAVLGLVCLTGAVDIVAQERPASFDSPRAEQTPLDGQATKTEIQELRAQLARLSARLDALEAQAGNSSRQDDTASPAAPGSASLSGGEATPDATSSSSARASTATPALQAEDAPTLDFLRSTTINFSVDGYYGYNTNSPIGRVNLLRAYDVSSNSFSLSQASFIVERLPSAESRFGGRIDLQFGQATETLQGSGANEQRPQVWRNLFQAYGSYLAPVGRGLRLDFGKWASSLGSEGNYTKDQIAYSRAYSFNYLPFYHTGMRVSYDVTSHLNVAYWLVNGVQQTEDFNGFKSQAVLLTYKPADAFTWNLNYYVGQEARDVQPTLYPGTPSAPTQPGLPQNNVSPAPSGREHILDSYATWQATRNLKLIGEADFVVNRTLTQQQPGRVAIGSLQAAYALKHNATLGARFEYVDDRSGLFSGVSQALKEFTVVADHQFAPGFLARAEFRRDFSNQRFFLTDTPGVTAPAQNTATLGLVYWWGTKQGSW